MMRTSPNRRSNSGADTSAGWEDAPTTFDRRAVMFDIIGETGTGRTSLALTAPGPIAFAHTAEKIDGIIQQFSPTKRIRVMNFGGIFRGNAEAIANAAAPVWEKLRLAWFNAIDTWAGSAIMDTTTEGWEMLRLARFGTLNPKGRVDNLYGPVNGEWRSMFKCVRFQDKCNIITIHMVKDEYVDRIVRGNKESIRTGRLIRSGMKEMGYIADVVVRTSKEDGIFKAVIEKGWFNAASEGVEFYDADISFPNIMSIVTGVDASEWARERQP